MRKKLVITRVGRQAPQSSQVWPEELPVPLAERAAQLYPLIASGTGTREEYLELAGELAKQMLYRQSAAALSAWLTGHPFDAECYCLRGRRYLAMMQYEQGAADLEMSARLDPDNWSTEYHRGLVHFIRGDFARASQAFLHCHALSADGGSLISAANWCYLSLMRQGRRAEAEALVGAIGEDIDYDENYSYYKSVMLFSGRMSVEETLEGGRGRPAGHHPCGQRLRRGQLLSGPGRDGAGAPLSGRHRAGGRAADVVGVCLPCGQGGPQAPVSGGSAMLIQNARILTMEGPDLAHGCIRVADGKIAAVAEALAPLPDEEVVDASGLTVMPGMVDAHCHVGLYSYGLGAEGSGTNEMTTPMTPQLSAIDSINRRTASCPIPMRRASPPSAPVRAAPTSSAARSRSSRPWGTAWTI